MFLLLLFAVYHLTMLGVESISVANYICNIALIGIVGHVLTFAMSLLIVVKMIGSQLLWLVFNSYLVPGFTSPKPSVFLKMNLPKLFINEVFFITLYLVGSKIL